MQRIIETQTRVMQAIEVITASFQALAGKLEKSEDEKILLERMLAFLGLCNQYSLFCEQFQNLLGWLESKTEHFAFAAVREVATQMETAIDIMSHYLNDQTNLLDVRFPFRKEKFIPDTETIQTIRGHAFAVNNALTSENIDTLAERAHIAVITSGLQQCSIFKPERNDLHIKASMQVLADLLTKGREKLPEITPPSRSLTPVN